MVKHWCGCQPLCVADTHLHPQLTDRHLVAHFRSCSLTGALTCTTRTPYLRGLT